MNRTPSERRHSHDGAEANRSLQPWNNQARDARRLCAQRGGLTIASEPKLSWLVPGRPNPVGWIGYGVTERSIHGDTVEYPIPFPGRIERKKPGKRRPKRKQNGR
jgi:hypothetical protein